MAAPPRSNHIALLVGNVLHVWGGIQYVNGEELVLPSDEIWTYDMESGLWSHAEIGGDVPPQLYHTCGSYLHGRLYTFGGRHNTGHTNQMFCVDLQDGKYTWREIRDCLGTPPSPREGHSCWVYKDRLLQTCSQLNRLHEIGKYRLIDLRLIYFGGYGCKTVSDANNNERFQVDETSWATNGNAFFRFYGWNNEVHMFEPSSATWIEPPTQGKPPEPRSSHASGILDNKGYICGGLETKTIDIYCLDLLSWTWTQVEPLVCTLPVGRSLHTLTLTSHNTLFLFGGLSASGHVLSDAWEFNTVTKEWREKQHAHKDKPRLWHSAVQGKDSDVVVFGGSREYVLFMDSVMVIRSPSQSHCGDVLVFQTQPYSLCRLCEDCIGKHGRALERQLSCLPSKIQEILHKRMTYFKTHKELKEQVTCT